MNDRIGKCKYNKFFTQLTQLKYLRPLFSGNILNKQLHLMKYEIEKRKIMLAIRKKKD